MRELSSSFLFRPFAGDIIKVKKLPWESPKHRSRTFAPRRSATFPLSLTPEVAGPGLFHAPGHRKTFFTLFTTPDPGAWVIARLCSTRGNQARGLPLGVEHVSANGVSRLRAKLETEAPDPDLYRDFPFGEEPSRQAGLHLATTTYESSRQSSV